MAHNITDVDAFTATVTVPDGIDSRANASAVVGAFVQALCNRTFNLQSHTAKLNLPNAFTAGSTSNTYLRGPIEVNDPDADNAGFVVRTTADDDSHPGNKYKAVEGYNVGASRGYMNVYTGTTGSEAQFIMAINAVWDSAAQNWFPDNTGFDSLALMWVQGSGLRVSRRPAGAGTWATWPTNAGDFDAGGTLTAKTLQSVDNTIVGSDGIGTLTVHGASTLIGFVDVTGILAATGNIRTGGFFNYDTPPTTQFLVSIFDAIGAYDGAGAGFVLNYDEAGLPYLKGSGATKIIEIPFKLPVGGTFTECQIMADVTGDLVAQVYKRSAYNFGGPTLPTESTLGGGIGVLGGGGGLAVYSSGAFSELVSRSAEYRLHLHADTGVKIYGIALTCTEPGPRN